MTSIMDDLNRRATWNGNSNATFITRIPKRKGVKESKDVRPISLISSIYKLLTKILAKILDLVMPSFISSSQCDFCK